MKRRIPELLDILQAVYDLYERGTRSSIITFYPKEVDDELRTKGFTITDTLIWERLNEYNKTIEIATTSPSGNRTLVYWLCEPHLSKKQEDNADTMPLMFRMGTVVNEISALTRKRHLETEQLRFWTVYKWAALATIGLAFVTSLCAVLNCWLAYHRP